MSCFEIFVSDVDSEKSAYEAKKRRKHGRNYDYFARTVHPDRLQANFKAFSKSLTPYDHLKVKFGHCSKTMLINIPVEVVDLLGKDGTVTLSSDQEYLFVLHEDSTICGMKMVSWWNDRAFTKYSRFKLDFWGVGIQPLEISQEAKDQSSEPQQDTTSSTEVVEVSEAHDDGPSSEFHYEVPVPELDCKPPVEACDAPPILETHHEVFEVPEAYNDVPSSELHYKLTDLEVDCEPQPQEQPEDEYSVVPVNMAQNYIAPTVSAGDNFPAMVTAVIGGLARLPLGQDAIPYTTSAGGIVQNNYQGASITCNVNIIYNGHSH